MADSLSVHLLVSHWPWGPSTERIHSWLWILSVDVCFVPRWSST